MRRSVSNTWNAGRMAAGLTASLLITGTFVILGAAPSYAVPPTTTVATPIPGLSAVCTPPPASKSVGQGGPAPVGFGVTATGAGGACTSSVTGFMAKASVGRTTFGANTVLSATAMCQDANTPSGQPVTVTSSAFYNGATITATTTIHTVDGYTLNFNVRTPNGAIALQIITPGGDVVNIAQVSCGGRGLPPERQPQHRSEGAFTGGLRRSQRRTGFAVHAPARRPRRLPRRQLHRRTAVPAPAQRYRRLSRPASLPGGRGG